MTRIELKPWEKQAITEGSETARLVTESLKIREKDAEITKLRGTLFAVRAERDELNEEIERCCKELGDAEILITQGPRDGITKLINGRDELHSKIADWRKGVELIASALGEINPSDLSCARIAEAVLTLRAERDAAVEEAVSKAWAEHGATGSKQCVKHGNLDCAECRRLKFRTGRL